MPGMPSVIPIGPQNEVVLPLRVPYFTKESDEIVAAIPELKAYLKAKYTRFKEVRFVYRNPRPDIAAYSLTYLHEAILYILVPGALFTKKLAERLADDTYEWLKKRFKKIRKGHKRRSRRS
jgi:hypothetical protein